MSPTHTLGITVLKSFSQSVVMTLLKSSRQQASRTKLFLYLIFLIDHNAMPKGNPKGAGIGKYVPKNKFQINEEKYDEKDNSEVDERDD